MMGFSAAVAASFNKKFQSTAEFDVKFSPYFDLFHSCQNSRRCLAITHQLFCFLDCSAHSCIVNIEMRCNFLHCVISLGIGLLSCFFSCLCSWKHNSSAVLLLVCVVHEKNVTHCIVHSYLAKCND